MMIIIIKKEGSKVPRKGHIPKRDVLPDPMYNDKVVTKLINNIMLQGKKGVAQKICYGAFEIIKNKTGKDPLEVFEQALNNIMPVLEVKARRVGGATYQVPMEVRPERRQALGLRWLVNYSRQRGERTMKERLAGEILDATNSLGGAYKKKEDTHKMAEANKAFAHITGGNIHSFCRCLGNYGSYSIFICSVLKYTAADNHNFLRQVLKSTRAVYGSARL
jgi:small subunit ribosomal protein S7